MNKVSFKINNKLRSFRLYDELVYKVHNIKERLRSDFFEFLGLGKKTLSQLDEMISSRDFNEPEDLFESVEFFFNSIYPKINLCIYRYQPFDNSLRFFRGDRNLHPRKIYLNDFDENEYIKERKAIKEQGELKSTVRGDHIGAKAAICINGYVLCFYINERHIGAHIRKLNAIFNIGFANMIRAKLHILEFRYQDPRTNLYNSKYLTYAGEKRVYSIIKIDINDFKMLNDTYGHAEGDKVLEELGVIFKASIGINDKACRDGGDEFVLLIDSSDVYVIEKIITRLQKNIDILNKKRAVPIYVSTGFCISNEGQSFIERLKLADDHMYTQKTDDGHIYRLAKKISSIKDPHIFNELLVQVIKNTSIIEDDIRQICDILKISHKYCEVKELK